MTETLSFLFLVIGEIYPLTFLFNTQLLFISYKLFCLISMFTCYTSFLLPRRYMNHLFLVFFFFCAWYDVISVKHRVNRFNAIVTLTTFMAFYKLSWIDIHFTITAKIINEAVPIIHFRILWLSSFSFRLLSMNWHDF